MRYNFTILIRNAGTLNETSVSKSANVIKYVQVVMSEGPENFDKQYFFHLQF